MILLSPNSFTCLYPICPFRKNLLLNRHTKFSDYLLEGKFVLKCRFLIRILKEVFSSFSHVNSPRVPLETVRPLQDSELKSPHTHSDNYDSIK